MKSRGPWLVVVWMLVLMLGSNAIPIVASHSPDSTQLRRQSAVLITPGAKAAPLATAVAAEAQHSAATTLMHEGFEGAWPGDGWQIVDMSVGGPYSWLKRFCVPHTGMYGGSVALTPYGGAPGCSSLYPNNASVAAVYGPFDLSSATTASLIFYVRGHTPSTTGSNGQPLDSLFVGSSTNGTDYSGNSYAGDWTTGPDGNGYTQQKLDLSSVAGQAAVWVTFWFESDASVNDIGFTVDDIALNVTNGSAPTPPPTGANTRLFLPLMTMQQGFGRIVYTHNDITQKTSIYIMNSDGSNQARVIACQPEGHSSMRIKTCDPALSPDGRRIAFLSKFSNDLNLNIYVVNIDGSGLKRITDDTALNAYPVWSTDGAKIMFIRNSPGDLPRSAAIYIMNADGTNPSAVAKDSDFQPAAWSPNGDRIAYSCIPTQQQRDDNSDLCVINADGTNRRVLVDNRFGEEVAPAWSPNDGGTRIAYIGTGLMGYVGDLYVINADGSGNPTTLLKSQVEDSGVSWSADGANIVYGWRLTLITTPTGDRMRSDIFVVDVHGAHEAKRLTTNAREYDFDVDPDWR